MRLIVVGDWHMKMVPGVPKQWQIDRHVAFIHHIVAECAKDGSVLALTGDCLDSIEPLKEELQLFMYLLHCLREERITVLLVSGNHETLAQGSSYLDFLEVHRFENVVYKDSYTHYPTETKFHLVQHDSIHTYKPKLGAKKNVLLSHARCTVPPHIKEEINFDEFTRPYDLCLLGDIHTDLSFGNVHYTNNPLNKVFETTPNTGYLVVNLDTLKVTRVKTDFPALVSRVIKAEAAGSLAIDPKHFYRVEVEGLADELRKIKSLGENVKLVKIPILPEALALDVPEAEEGVEEVSIADGLVGYMKYLKFDDTLIANLLEEYGRPIADD